MGKRGVLRFFKIAIQRLDSAELTSTSVIIAFYALLSFFPLLILIGNLLPLFHLTPEAITSYLETLVPQAVLPVLEPIALSLLKNSSGGLLSVSSIALLWSAGRGISYLQNGMNRVYGIPTDRSYIARHLIGFFFILLIILLVGLFLLLFSFSDMLLAYLAPEVPWAGPVRDVVRGVKWPVALVFLFCLFTPLYVIAPSARLRVRDAMPGAIFSSIGLILLVQLFALYVNFSTRLLSSYGALSSFFVLMFWLNISAMIVVLGALLNASVQEFRFGKIRVDASRIDSLIDNRVLSPLQKFWRKRKDTKKVMPEEKDSAALDADGGADESGQVKTGEEPEKEPEKEPERQQGELYGGAPADTSPEDAMPALPQNPEDAQEAAEKKHGAEP